MNCKAFQDIFLRRKKLVVEGDQELLVLDTAKETLSIKFKDLGHKGIGRFSVVDPETLVTRGPPDNLVLIDLVNGKIKATQSSITYTPVKLVVIGDWIYAAHQQNLLRTKKDLSGKTRAQREGSEATRELSEEKHGSSIHALEE